MSAWSYSSLISPERARSLLMQVGPDLEADYKTTLINHLFYTHSVDHPISEEAFENIKIKFDDLVSRARIFVEKM